MKKKKKNSAIIIAWHEHHVDSLLFNLLFPSGKGASVGLSYFQKPTLSRGVSL